MTVFYPGPCVRVTHKVFEAHHPSYRSFVIRELRHVHVIQEQADVLGVGSAPIRIASTGLAGVAAMAAAVGWAIFDSPLTSVAALMVLAMSSVVSGACWRTRGHAHLYELRAVHHGQPICLFQTTDVRVFGQVSRALCRAMEQNTEVW
jgi:hypothetical protein